MDCYNKSYSISTLSVLQCPTTSLRILKVLNVDSLSTLLNIFFSRSRGNEHVMLLLPFNIWLVYYMQLLRTT